MTHARGSQLLQQLRHERAVPRRLRRHPHDVHVRVHRVARDLGGGHEQGADVYVKPQVGQAGQDGGWGAGERREGEQAWTQGTGEAGAASGALHACTPRPPPPPP